MYEIYGNDFVDLEIFDFSTDRYGPNLPPYTGLCETMLGKEHPSTLASINNLAAALRDRGWYEQAEKMYRQELRLCNTTSSLKCLACNFVLPAL